MFLWLRTFPPRPRYTSLLRARSHFAPRLPAHPFSTSPQPRMPELPEAERATRLLRETIKGGTIGRVETAEDTIVFEGASHTEFAAELTGRTVLDVHRYGKVFWLELSVDPAASQAPTATQDKVDGQKAEGHGQRHPVFHLGMTGMIQIHGREPTWYRVRPKDVDSWPPKYMKFIIHVSPPSSTPTDPPVQFAFIDPRRLARIRLRARPREEKPISELGFDPVLSMPVLDEFVRLARGRGVPVKALLLDQGFSAGVGNWVADEILYHAHVHPEQRANTLSDGQLERLHHFTRWICTTAVAANADAALFPPDWLFKHRWGKGKKAKGAAASAGLVLKSGELATIKWTTVGGRTSAYVEEVQKLQGGGSASVKKSVKRKSGKNEDGDEVEEVEETVEEESQPPKRKRTKKTVTVFTKSAPSPAAGARASRKPVKAEPQDAESDLTELEEDEPAPDPDEKPTAKSGSKSRKTSNIKTERVGNGALASADSALGTGRRRSARLSKP